MQCARQPRGRVALRCMQETACITEHKSGIRGRISRTRGRSFEARVIPQATASLTWILCFARAREVNDSLTNHHHRASRNISENGMLRRFCTIPFDFPSSSLSRSLSLSLHASLSKHSCGWAPSGENIRSEPRHG